MAIPARLSVLSAQAQARADAVYDEFRSREDAILNEEYGTQLEAEVRASLLEEFELSSEQLDAVIEEYQLSLGAPLR